MEITVRSDNAESDTPPEFFSISHYELISISKKALSVQLHFEMPEQISYYLVNPDFLDIRIKKGFIFIDETDFQRLEEDVELDFELPQQVSLLEFGLIQKIGQTSARTTQSFCYVTFLVCLILGYGLNHIWEIINVLQFPIIMLRWEIYLSLVPLEILKSL